MTRKEECPECGQNTVITPENEFAWHRWPAFTDPFGVRRLGDWCEMSGEEPVDE